VPRSRLVSLYRGARAVLFPSIADARGRPDIDPAVFAAHYPDVSLADLTEAKAEALCAQSMDAAMRVFRDGFRYTGEPFPGRGLSQRNIHRPAWHVAAGTGGLRSRPPLRPERPAALGSSASSIRARGGTNARDGQGPPENHQTSRPHAARGRKAAAGPRVRAPEARRREHHPPCVLLVQAGEESTRARPQHLTYA